MHPHPTPLRRRAVAVAAIGLAVALAACGGNERAPAANPTESPTPGVTASTPGSPPASTTSPTSDPKTRPSVTVKPSPGSTAPGSTIVLDLKCARRGFDVQGITVQTRPGGPAGFNTQYSDGSSSVDGKSNYSSGFGGGFADASGTWRATWTVPENAPLGVATVRALTQDGSLDLKFTVVAKDGSCPS